MKAIGLFIAGHWRSGNGRDELLRCNPTTDAELGRLTVAGKQDVLDALDAARAAFPTWRATAAVERAALLQRVGAAIRARAAEFGQLIATELGNVLPAATFEAMVAASKVTLIDFTNGGSTPTAGTPNASAGQDNPVEP